MNVPNRALNAGSIFPPEAIKTASMTPSSTFGNASFSVALACALGLWGREVRRGASVGDAVVEVTVVPAAAGVGSKLLSSGRVSTGLSAILQTRLVVKQVRSALDSNRNLNKWATSSGLGLFNLALALCQPRTLFSLIFPLIQVP